MTRIGRPPRPYQTVLKGIRMRVDLARALETQPNQRKIVEEALDMYFNLKDSSEQFLWTRLEELHREEEAIKATLKLKDKEKKEKKILEIQNQEQQKKESEAKEKRIQEQLRDAFDPYCHVGKEMEGKVITKEYIDAIPNKKCDELKRKVEARRNDTLR